MIANSLFISKEERFWAVVKMVSEVIGYSVKSKEQNLLPKMKRYDENDLLHAFTRLNLPTGYCFSKDQSTTLMAQDILAYLNFRSQAIEEQVIPHLMNKEQARNEYERLLKKYPQSKFKVIMNKQKGDKSHPNYLVNIVNLIGEDVLGYANFDGDPLKLGIVSDDIGPIKTLCRRMDGAFPSTFKPRLIWEVKEYYGTTTFGSRIADGVYETMLVGEELKNLFLTNNIKIHHALFVDDRFTWGVLGRSYLCRLVDLLHTGHVDAVFFGDEVLTEWKEFLKTFIELPS